ncbi:MAG: Helix-turn-helix domain [Firmicutes bacterium]|nr:Helix-turn-helix domain [Bacillota bacterium]
MLRTIKQLAEFTGVSDTVVRSWIKRYKLPILKIEGRIYIQDEEYAKWLEEHKAVVDQIKRG